MEIPRDPNYYASTDMTDKAIAWVSPSIRSPLTSHFSFTTPAIGNHGPFQVPEKWRNKYKGKFDQGWDQVRKETLARPDQARGRAPDTKLAPKPPGIQEWDQLNGRREEGLCPGHMEIYAALWRR